MSDRSYYDILGVAKDADEKQIKSAYRKLAMKFHPDRNPDDPEAEAKFKEAGEAYSILSDGDKRAAYDRYGKAAFEQGGGGGNPFGQGVDPGDIFGDIFSEFFGGSRGGGRAQARGQDLRYDLEISLEDAFNGRDMEITLPGKEACDRCDGQGAEPGTQPETCTTCHGRGRVRVQQGFFTMERGCPKCAGRGTVIKDPCRQCAGQGYVQTERTLSINIPAGIESGQRIRLSGEGDPGGPGVVPGDLYIFVEVLDHEIFERDGPNLYCRAPVTMVTAALGGDIEIPTVEGGRSRITIPEGAQTGRRMRLRGKGMTSLRGGPRGDLYVELFVETPQKLTARQKELMREFCDESGEDCNPESNGFLGKVKRFWDDLTDADEAR
ncbi:molecular chaperone DnaJ [Ponticaulis sp.]|uniref:molecular chaperone DnaJ n=1 Tax=Ponticaulis sp. TaxID=2020902 RepID=UPI00263840C9|nr:molecular chaperone DnaJ [Ponticaulis sp.]MDF1679794.1 molecular chaperone DnaJ [Ponticaulis sp.]